METSNNSSLGGLSQSQTNETLQLKKLRNELRISKKAEQIAKEKLLSTKNQLERSQQEFEKYKEDAENRVDGLKTEISILQGQLTRSLQESAELERQSQGSNNGFERQNSDMLKIVEDYTKQNDQKVKEINDLTAKLESKKENSARLKKQCSDQEQKITRMQSKLENMAKISNIFIKSMRQQNLALQETVQNTIKEQGNTFDLTKQKVRSHIDRELTSIKRQLEEQLSSEKRHVKELQEKLDSQGVDLGKSAAEQEKHINEKVLKLKNKIVMLKEKLAKSPEKDLSRADQEHKAEVIRLQIEAEKSRADLQLQERQREITQLTQQIKDYQKKEAQMVQKLEEVEKNSRAEYQRMVELQESSGRYKELRDLYENKLQLKEAELLDSKEELIKLRVLLEQAEQKANDKTEVLKLQKMVDEETEKAVKVEMQLFELQKELQSKESAFGETNRLTGENERLQSQVVNKDGQIERLNRTIEGLQKEVQQLQDSHIEEKAIHSEAISNLSLTHIKEIEALREELNQAKLVVPDTKEIIVEVEKVIEKEVFVDRVVEKVVELPVEVVKIVEKEVEVIKQEDTSAMKAQLTELQQENHRLGVEIQELTNEAADAQRVAKQKVIELTDKNKRIASLEQQLAKNKHELDEVKFELEQAEVKASVVAASAAAVEATRRRDRSPARNEQKRAVSEMPSKRSQEATPTKRSRASSPEIQAPPKEPSNVKNTVTNEEQKAQENPGAFGNIINGFLGFLTRRRQAFTGKPASAMYYDEKLGRYVFPGEEMSDDDEPPPPPKVNTTQAKIEAAPEEKKEEEPKQGVAAITTVAFGGALANRGRGRGRGRGSTPVRFPQTPGMTVAEPSRSQESEVKQATESSGARQVSSQAQKEKPDVTQTALDQTVNEDLYRTTLDTSVADASLNMTAITANQSMIDDYKDKIERQNEEAKEREELWQQKYQRQNEKIASLRYQVSQMHNELMQEKEHNKVTIENLEQFTAALKQEGENFSEQIKALKRKLRDHVDQRAIAEVKAMSAQQQLTIQAEDLMQLRESNRTIKCKLLSAEVELEMAKLQSANEEQSPCDHQEEILNLQVERETLLWSKSALDAQRQTLSQQNQSLQQTVSGLRQQIEILTVQIQQLEEVNQKHQLEQTAKAHEKLKLLERERENLKDMLQKLSQEKERTTDQIKQRLAEKDAKLRQTEQEKQTKVNQLCEQIRDKERALQQKLAEISQQKDQEISQLQAKFDQQSSDMQKLLKKKQIEAQKAEHQIKSQLASLQGIVSQKEHDLDSLKEKTEDMSQELQTADRVKEKLNEHIIYLQYEIRKRDELLDEESDFAEDEYIDQSDSMFGEDQSESARHGTPRKSEQSVSRRRRKTLNQVIKDQLDETRLQLKQNIESKLRLEKQTAQNEIVIQKLTQDLNEILQVITGGSNDEVLGAEQVSDQIISEFFKVQRENESKVLELTHQLDIAHLQSEEAENLKFDLEILHEEKQFLEQELVREKEQADQWKAKLSETHAKQVSQESDIRKALMESHSKQIQQIQTMNQAALKEKDEQALETLRKAIENIKEEHDSKIATQKYQLQSSQTACIQFESQIQELRIELDHSSNAQQELHDQINTIVRQKQDSEMSLQHTIGELKELLAAQEAQLQQVNDSCEKLQGQLDQKSNMVHKSQSMELSLRAELAESQAKIEKMGSDFEEIAQVFMQKKEGLKEQIKQLKGALKETAAQLQSIKHEQVAKEQETDKVSANVEAQLQRSRTEIQEWESRFERAENKSSELFDKLTKCQSERDTLKEKSRQLKAALKEAASRMEEQESESSAVQGLKQELEQAKEDLKTSQEQADQLLTKMQHEAEEAISKLKSKSKGREDKLKAKMVEMQQTFESISGEKMSHEEANLKIIEGLKQEIEQLESQLSNLQSNAETEQVLLQSQNEQLAEKIQLAQTKLEKVQEALLEAQKENNCLQEQLSEKLGNESEQLQASLEKQKVLQEEIKGYTMQIEELKGKIQTCENKIADQEKQFSETEEVYIQEAQKLATEFKAKSKEHKQAKSEFKAHMKQIIGEYEQLKDSSQREAQILTDQVQSLTEKLSACTGELQGLKEERNNLSTSLDLTKVSFKEQTSQLEEERHLLSMASQSTETSLRSILISVGIEVSEELSLQNMLEKLSEEFTNYQEDKRTLQEVLNKMKDLSDVEENLRRQIFDKEGEISRLNAIIERGDSGKLLTQIKQLQEERSELRNDYIIKFDSFSQEVSMLKSRLAKHEPVEEKKVDPSSTEKPESPVKTNQYRLDDGEDAANVSQRSGISGMLASLFLTDKELGQNKQ